VFALVAASLSLLSAPAYAQNQPAGVRYRFGVAGSGGGAFVSNVELGMGGIDLRFGAQLNRMLGVYAQPFLMFGGTSLNGRSAATGFLGSSVVVDATFMDHFFVGVGGGGAILNNPTALFLHGRAGFYPVVGNYMEGGRRRRLMVGVDVRSFFALGTTVLNVMASVGYEAF
jgi:hypothetical protein